MQARAAHTQASVFRATTLGARPVTKVASKSRRCVSVRAIFPLADIAPQVATTASNVANQANNLAPGSVDAPGWVIPVAALVVTVVGGASAILLKPGADAAEKIFERDARKMNSKARANMKAQQTIRGSKR